MRKIFAILPITFLLLMNGLSLCKVYSSRSVLFLIIIVTHTLSACKNDAKIVYDYSLEQIKESAMLAGKDFCVVLSHPGCPPCASFIENLDNRHNRRLIDKVIFNVVDVSQPENKWYSHWFCSGAFPTTCVFSPEGKLKSDGKYCELWWLF